jgi:two-component system, chemotaxis family, CheB/CheR fusion protein
VAGAGHEQFYVVGIGASAGGLSALRTFFSRMPAKPGFACVVVVHLSPEHESHLVDLLQPYTQMPVRQVVKTTALEPNHVYVIPPNANLNSIDTHLRLSELEVRRFNRAPIDHFLRTLAETHGERAIGVVLSGSGSDGALGIRQIREFGGFTLAQDPEEAEYGSMPQNAISTGTVDKILPARDMAEEIARYCETQPQLHVPGSDDGISDAESARLEQILGRLRLRTGQEFGMYTHRTLLQRVRRRMQLHHIETLVAYCALLDRSTEEPRELCNDLLLNVTEFFREPENYDTLAQGIDEILQHKGELDPRIRVWSIACSTGEEAYSLGMLLIEQTATREPRLTLQVFASELSARALAQAREGLYPHEIAASISSHRLERFFVNEAGHYRVRRELRDIVTFSNHDLFKDPPYAHLDLIVCRHLLHDLQPQMRLGVLNLFYYALEPHGLLFINPDDEIELGDLFTRDAKNPALLRRRGGLRRPVHLPPGVKPFAGLTGERAAAMAPFMVDLSAMFRAATEQYALPSVMIDAQNRVVHFSSSASRYVRIPGGELRLELLEMLPGALGYHVKTGLQDVRAANLQSWQSDPFIVTVGGKLRRMAVHIDRVSPGGRRSDLMVVVFDDRVDASYPDADSTAEGKSTAQIKELEEELIKLQEKLAGLVTSDTTRASEHQAREAQLNALTEELESAREELQAVNEELISLNEENLHRLEALSQLSNDLEHLLESTGLATLVVDTSLKIRRFTPLATQLFRLQPTDIGRPLRDLTPRLRYGNLVADVERVIAHHAELELELELDNTSSTTWFMVRIQPYRSALRGIEGAVVVLIDISARKQAEIALRDADRRKDEFLAVLAHELRNPLAPISAGIEILRKIPDNPELMTQVTTTMRRQTQQLVRLVDDLLEVGRISGGKLVLRIKPVQVAEAVRDAVAAVSPLIESLQHRLTVAIPEESLLVAADAARLTQVIANLLNNAARYTPSGGQLSLTVQRDDSEVVIIVHDNGLGISEAALPNIFEMFYQGHASSGGAVPGLGIGLTLAKKLVEMHGGRITAQSAGINGGSTFTVVLPLTNSALESDPPSAHAVVNGATAKRRVLIVDDNVDAAETMRMLMTTLGGGEVQTASSGAEALQLAARLHPDLVLLDLSMPGMDGYEVARRMRGETWGRRATLVALTGWGQDQHRRRSQEAGFDQHMTKPASADALRAVLAAEEK